MCLLKLGVHSLSTYNQYFYMTLASNILQNLQLLKPKRWNLSKYTFVLCFHKVWCKQFMIMAQLKMLPYGNSSFIQTVVVFLPSTKFKSVLHLENICFVY